MNTKKCTKCNEIKDLSIFYKNKSKKDGLYSACKKCIDIDVKNYQNTFRGKEVAKKAKSKYRKTDKGRITQQKSDKKRRRKPEVKEANKIKRKLYERSSIGKAMKARSVKKYLESSRGWKLHLLKNARWAKENPGKINAKNARRHAQKLQSTPKWLTKDQLKKIEEYYVLAKELQWLSEEPLEVDHILPIQGENVCGLHVPWNLQILPKSMNISKSNKIKL